jgi:beta-lactamase superfamily II metal-dependent hydrolase
MAASPLNVPPALEITAIDVEGGAAALYVTPQGHSLLIDSGWPTGMGGIRAAPGETAPATPSSAERIVAVVRAAGLTRIDYLLITHYHIDHVGGAVELLSRFPVGTVIDHGPNREQPAENASARAAAAAPATNYPKYLAAIGQRPHRVMEPGDTLSIDDMKITAVNSDGAVLETPLGKGQPGAGCSAATTNDDLGGEENPRSLGVLITYGRARVLSLADTTWNVENRLVCPRDLIGPVDLMFADNHGSDNSNSPPLLNTVQPRVVVFQNGPTKGAAAQSISTVLASARIHGVWQMHYAEQHPDVNAPPANIANLSGREDIRYSLQIAVDRDGGLAFTNPRTGTTTRY